MPSAVPDSKTQMPRPPHCAACTPASGVTGRDDRRGDGAGGNRSSGGHEEAPFQLEGAQGRLLGGGNNRDENN